MKRRVLFGYSLPRRNYADVEVDRIDVEFMPRIPVAIHLSFIGARPLPASGAG